MYFANSELLPPLPAMLQQMVLLCASYVSVLWLVTSQLRGFGELSTFALAVSCFAVHGLVLMQRLSWYRKALEHDEALEQRKLLRLTEDFPAHGSGFGLDTFNILLALILIGVTLKLSLVASTISDVLPVCTVIVNLGIHAASRWPALTAVRWWRKPQAKASELLTTVGEQLPITSEKPKLSKGRALKALALEYCTHTVAVMGLVAAERQAAMNCPYFAVVST